MNDEIDFSGESCVVFQLINPLDGTRTSVVNVPVKDVLSVLEKSNQDAFINVMTLDSLNQFDPLFCLHPLVRVSNFVDFYKDKFPVDGVKGDSL